MMVIEGERSCQREIKIEKMSLSAGGKLIKIEEKFGMSENSCGCEVCVWERELKLLMCKFLFLK